MAKIEKAYIYKMTVDSGFAPHIKDGICSLATCKPSIRRSVFSYAITLYEIKKKKDLNRKRWHSNTCKREDNVSLDKMRKESDFIRNKNIWVIGVASKKLIERSKKLREGQIIYAMHVTDILTHGEYWCCNEYKNRKPSKENPIGDNAYEIDESSASIKQLLSQHRLNDTSFDVSNFIHDLSGEYVLLSDDYYYFGDSNNTLKILRKIERGHIVLDLKDRTKLGNELNNLVYEEYYKIGDKKLRHVSSPEEIIW